MWPGQGSDVHQDDTYFYFAMGVKVQAMRVSGYTAGGEALPEELVWPWKGCFELQ